MTVGEGIFWSTLLILAFFSIVLLTKHERWRSFWKVLGWIVGFGAIIGAAVWLYLKYDSRPQLMTSLNGISLGMSEVEITLTKGAPDRIVPVDSSDDEHMKFLLYKGSLNSYTVAILRGPEDTMIVTDICDKEGYGKVLGFGHHTSEGRLVAKLGEPSSVSINREGTVKRLTYPKWNAAFAIEKGDVIEVCVTSRSEMRFTEEYGDRESESEGPGALEN